MDKRINASFLPSVANRQLPRLRKLYVAVRYNEGTGELVLPVQQGYFSEFATVMADVPITITRDGRVHVPLTPTDEIPYTLLAQ